MITLVFEFLLYFIFQLLLEIVGQVLISLGVNSMVEALQFKSDKNPVQAFFGHILLGLIAGGLSLWIFPDLFVFNNVLRMANLVITPVVVGLLMSALGAWRARKSFAAMRMDSFAYGFIFAFSISLIRYFFSGR